MVTFHIFVRGVYLESSLQVKQNTLDTNQKIGFLRIIAELTFIRQVNNREPSFMIIVFSPYYYFCFCCHPRPFTHGGTSAGGQSINGELMRGT